VGDAVHVGDGDAAGADFHDREPIIFAFYSPGESKIGSTSLNVQFALIMKAEMKPIS